LLGFAPSQGNLWLAFQKIFGHDFNPKHGELFLDALPRINTISKTHKNARREATLGTSGYPNKTESEPTQRSNLQRRHANTLVAPRALWIGPTREKLTSSTRNSGNFANSAGTNRGFASTHFAQRSITKNTSCELNTHVSGGVWGLDHHAICQQLFGNTNCEFFVIGNNSRLVAESKVPSNNNVGVECKGTSNHSIFNIRSISSSNIINIISIAS